MRLGPDLLAMSAPRKARESARDGSGAATAFGAAQQVRQALVEILPANGLGGLGRGLVFAGAGILVVRLLAWLGEQGGRR